MIELSYLDLLRLIVDFGLVILTWLVQLVIYPSFLYYQKIDLDRWHPIYTRGITLVVLPLMVTQLFIGMYQCFTNFDVSILTYFVLIAFTWLITFIKAVPLHSEIDMNATPTVLRNLIRVHTYRTILWTIIFVWNIWFIL